MGKISTDNANDPSIILTFDEDGRVSGFFFIAKSEQDEILLLNAFNQLFPCMAGVSI
jgi:hypothetical protein